ncbi:ADP-ribose pyrophosphatase YjhB (NUDIX family) [Amycolatopsis echigonensis]|uniref:ADP-ribose pyrophosphatase YjhB (NUDIX family) n=1 Tax=Amycolatopsis echigonensis TaxID=2576905 RepID=A0A2N3X0E4_9PSEU|nr:NUDIX hydrolase [Amycolatopsis niigatensis]PKV99579.1 ADP-ribose pyrophosphatase YjhB (NUDIX family) [Amycolatopsis niigatensis]
MSDPTEKFATPRVAAGALFVDGDRVLLVRKTYGNRWDIPGGYVDRGESPAGACQRELREELSLDRAPVHLLVQDWAPNEKEGDKLLYVFDCGPLGDDEHRITLDGQELDHWEWVPVSKLDDYLIPRLARRLSQAFKAHKSSTTVYLEHGEPALGAPTE